MSFSVEPRIEFINKTPDTTGPNITSDFQIEGCVNETVCKIGRNGDPFACELPAIPIYLLCSYSTILWQAKTQCSSYATVPALVACLLQPVASVAIVKHCPVFCDLVSQ